jgi:hypothetical protein
MTRGRRAAGGDGAGRARNRTSDRTAAGLVATLGQATPLSDLLDRIIRQLAWSMPNVKAALVWVWDASEGALLPRAIQGKAIRDPHASVEIRLLPGEWIPGRVFTTQTPVILPNRIGFEPRTPH